MTVQSTDWRISRGVALVIGWLSFFVSCGLIYLIYEYPGHFGNSVHETIVPVLPVCNMLACYCWFFGIEKIRFGYMFSSLVFWGINLILVIICVFSSTLQYKDDNKRKSSLVSIYFSVPTVFYLVSYYVSIVCYTIMKKTAPKIAERTMV